MLRDTASEIEDEARRIDVEEAAKGLAANGSFPPIPAINVGLIPWSAKRPAPYQAKV